MSWEDVAACSCIDFTVCPVYFGVFRLCYPERSDVLIVLVFHVVEFGGSLEAFHRCSCLVICVIKWSCVLTLGTVLRLFFHVYVLDFSLVTLNALSAHVCEMSNSVACVALHSQGSTLLSGVVCSSPTISTYLCCTVPVVLPGSGPVAPVGSPTPVGAASAPVACPTSIVVRLVLV